MSNDLTLSNTALNIWEDEKSLAEIKQIFCPLLNDSEFKTFIGMGKATGLNPFLKEIYAIKFDPKQAATFVIARDGYRKSAQRQIDYDYHRVEAVYSEDEFENNNGVVNHKYKFAKRGVLIAAYCLVKRKSSSREMYVSVPLVEYDKSQSCWKNMKETMLKKTAEAQGLKAAFQELFAGSISEEEYDLIKSNNNNPQSQTQNIKNRLTPIQTPQGKVIDADPVPQAPSAISNPESKAPVHNAGRDDISISPEQVDFIYSTINEKQIPDERITKAMDYFKVDCVESMTDAQARLFILQLSKL